MKDSIEKKFAEAAKGLAIVKAHFKQALKHWWGTPSDELGTYYPQIKREIIVNHMEVCGYKDFFVEAVFKVVDRKYRPLALELLLRFFEAHDVAFAWCQETKRGIGDYYLTHGLNKGKPWPDWVLKTLLGV